MVLKKWNELPVELRRSPAKRWNYLVDELNSSSDEETEDNSEEEEFTPVTYQFTSYADDEGETEYGTGTVETTGVTSNGYTQVKVLTNSADDSFVGQKFFVVSDAKTDGETLYQLYSDAGETGTGLYVAISSEDA